MAIEKIEKQPYVNDLINTINKTIDAINTLNEDETIDGSIAKAIAGEANDRQAADAAIWDGNKLVFPNGNKLWIG